VLRPVLLSVVLLLQAGPALALDDTLAATSIPASAACGDLATAGAPALLTVALAPVAPAVDNMLLGESALRFPGLHRGGARAPRPAVESMPLGPERTRVLLRSLTVPGWGQATLGHRRSAAVFGVAELGVWTAFASFRVQELLRRLGYERTAKIYAGIDLKGRDDEYRRIVGYYRSSSEYNLYVVARDAANLYTPDPYNNPDMAGYNAYIAAHSIKGSDAWDWGDQQSFDRYGARYRAERKNSQRASLRSNAVLGLAIGNRLVSAALAMRASAHPVAAKPQRTSWRFEVAPGELTDPGSFRAGLHASF
jgi:hypothetical protein